ncbi:MAG: ShlB/FhaC/HecB family hemolysin secretion/activation protein [Bacteroidota bacterium]
MIIFSPRLLWRVSCNLLLFLVFFYAASGGLLGAPASAATAPSHQISPSSHTHVKHIILSPAKHLSKRAQRKLVSPYLNSFLSPARIQTLIDDVRAHYIIKGYPTTQVYVVADPTDPPGTLRLTVIHGFIEQIRLGSNRPWERRQVATAFPFLQGGPLYLPALSQGIDVLNNVPSHGASMTILPGNLTGGSVIQINNSVAHRWRVDLGVDNLGEKASGELRGKVNLGLDNLLSLNDVLTLHCSLNKARKVWKKSQQKDIPLYNASLMASLSFPVGAYSFSSSYATSRALSPAQAHLETYLYKTANNSLSFQVKRLLLQGWSSKTFVELGLTRKDSTSWLEDTLIGNQSRKLSIADGTLSYIGLLGGGQTTASVSYHQGLPIWSALKDASPAAAQAPKAQFRKLNLSFLWVRFVPLSSQRHLQYQFHYASQHSKDRLYSSEQMSLSGLDRLRGLTTSVGTDEGFFVRQELSLLGFLSFSRLTAPLQPFVGLDGGYALSKDPRMNHQSLLCWAAGFKYQGYRLYGEVSYARMPQGGSSQGYKLYLNLSISLHQLFSRLT